MRRNKDINALYLGDHLLSECLIRGNLGIFKLLKEYIIKEVLMKQSKE